MPVRIRFSASFYRKFFTQSTILTSCFFINYALADTLTFSPTAPGISVTGLSGDITTGYADILLPIVGQPTEFFYVDPQGLVHSSQDYSAALGLGARKLTDSLGILGAYVYGDYNHAPDGHGFWFVSPGIERFGDRIDFSANVYLPVGSTQVNSGTFFGDQAGIYDNVFFTGHNEYDVFYNSFEAVGTGVDAEVGYRLPVRNNTKIYVGGYYFDPKNVDHIAGATARLEIPFTEHVNVDLSDGYDNYAHNTFKVGLSYNFGGRHTPYNFKDNLAERMVDPTRRNLIAVSGSAHTAQPIVDGVSATPQVGLVMSNISFFFPSFGPTAVVGDGSFEHPYIGFNQDNVDNANAKGNTNFFLQGQMGPYISNDQINLSNDSIYGRESYQGRLFLAPAFGNNRPLFEFSNSNGFVWNVNSSNSNIMLTSIRLDENALGNIGILFNNQGSGVANMNVDNVSVTSSQSLASFAAFSSTNFANGTINLVVNDSVFQNTTVGFTTANNQLGVFNLTFNNSFVSDCADGFSTANLGGGAVHLVMNNSLIEKNNFVGLNIFNDGGITTATLNGSGFNQNGTNGVEAFNNAGSVYIVANRSSFNDNQDYGIQATNVTSIVNNGSTFSGNGLGPINP